ncbi:MAG: Lrp/AsnC family transcriptional regulator [Oscillospiraceae bacterium]|jgi:DNA-binding Lrp family transcriptional regulator|nr:Lrp/AsnC family transcriptional regulator [Oscillospiraceae bacterium]
MNIEKLLRLLEENARYTNSDLAVMLGEPEEAVAVALADLEKNGIIRGYKPVINWSAIDDRQVTALIELKVTPKKDVGYEEVAAYISKFDEVETVYLISGGFDLAVIVRAKTLKEVAEFSSKHLSTIESVTAVSSHYVLNQYKDMGVKLREPDTDDRGQMSF